MSDLIFTEQGAGTTPSAGKHTVYYKTDGKLYTKDTTGTEISLPTLTEIAAAVLTLTNKTLTSPVINGFSGTGNGAMTGNLAVTGTLSANGLTVIGSTPTFSPTVGTDAALLRFNNTGTGDVFVGKDNSAGSGFGGGVAYSANLYNGGNTPMIFWTNGVQRMQIGASGGLAVTGALSATGTTLLGGTTDSASGSKTQSPSFEVRAAGSDSFQQGLFFGGSASTGNIQAGGVADALDVWTFAGAWGKRARFSSTGFAVTGAINTTGTISATTPEGLRVIDADPYVSFFNAANTVRRGYIQANATSSRLTIAAESTLTSIQSLIGSAVVTSVSSTGLAVTGTLSATGNIKAGGNAILETPSWDGNFLALRHSSLAQTAATSALCQSAAGTTFLNSPSGQPLYLSVNITPVATITSTGLAVIGTLSASNELKVSGANQINAAARVVLSYEGGGNSYIQPYGVDNATPGVLVVRPQSANGSVGNTVATFSPSGLAVTGALSATGVLSAEGGVLDTGVTGTAATGLSVFSMNRNGATGALRNSNMMGFSWVLSASGGANQLELQRYNSAGAFQERTFIVDSAGKLTVGAGLAVTGALSATGGGVISTLANVGANSLVNLTTANSAVKLGVGYVGTDNPAIQAYDTTNNARTLDLNPLGGLVRASGGLAVTGTLSATGALTTAGLKEDASGNLGLGVTPSAWGAGFKALQLGSNGVIYSAGAYNYFGSNTYYDGANLKYLTTAAAGLFGSEGGAYKWYTAPSGTAGNPLTFTTAMVLDASGNLGLGVTPSISGNARSLEIASSATYAGPNLFNINGSSNAFLGNNAYFNAGFFYKVSGASATMYQQQGGAHNWQTAPSGTAGNSIPFSTSMVLDASGNLGLGVTPSAWGGGVLTAIDIKSSAAFAGSTGGAYVIFNAFYDGAGFRYKTANNACYSAAEQGAHKWYTAPSGTAGNPITFTQAMTLDASGNLSVGVTTATNTPANGLSMINAGGATQLGIGHSTGTLSGTGYLLFNYAAGVIGSITQSGTTAVLYNTTSDARLKENITNASDAASLIDALQVRQFDWKSDGSHQRYGFVAQELYEVAPEAVSKPQDPDEMMAVDYSKLVPMLVLEIQSLRQRLATAGI